MPPRALRLLPCLALVLLTSCVTESVTPIPDWQVSAPPIKSVVSGKVSLSLVSLGSFPYDGMTLPLVAPDASFIAVQEGDPPSWPLLIGEHDPRASVSRRIQVYRISSPASDALAPVLVPMPPRPELDGVLLARSCDSKGFLISRVSPSGTSIEAVPWEPGPPILIGGGLNQPGFAAMPTFLPVSPSLVRAVAYCWRMSSAEPFELRIASIEPGASRATHRAAFSVPGCSIMMPLASSGEVLPGASVANENPQPPSVSLHTTSQTPTTCTLDLLCVPHLQPTPEAVGQLVSLAVSATAGAFVLRQTASREWPDASTPIGAFQSAAPAQTPWPAPLSMAGAGVTLFSSSLRAAVFLPLTDKARAQPLGSASVVGVPLRTGNLVSLAVATDRLLTLRPPFSGGDQAEQSPSGQTWQSGGVPLLRGAIIPRSVRTSPNADALLVLELNTSAGLPTCAASIISQNFQSGD